MPSFSVVVYHKTCAKRFIHSFIKHNHMHHFLYLAKYSQVAYKRRRSVGLYPTWKMLTAVTNPPKSHFHVFAAHENWNLNTSIKDSSNCNQP